MKKRLLSMALVLVMMLSLLPATAVTALAAAVSTASTTSGTKLTNEYGFKIDVPDDFESDTSIPYGNGTGPVNLSPVKEIGVFESSANTWHSRVYNFTEKTMLGTDPNKNLFSSSSQSWIQDNIVFPAQSHFFHPSTAMTTQVMAASSPLESASGTSLDPGGDGRDNVLAYYGRNRSSGQLQLYIYKADRANHDTVTGAAWTGSAESSYSWMSETTPYNNEGYLSIVSGDFDGDGKDTLVLYDPAAGNIQLREFKVTDEINGRASQVVSYALGSRSWLAGKFGLTPNQIQKMSGNTAKARNTAMVQMTAGDIDGDQKDELIVTLSLPNMVDENGWITNRSSVLMVLDKNPSDKYFTCNWFQQLAYVYDPIKPNTVGDSGCWWMRAASSAVGDVDGDGKAEILTVGVGSNDNGDDDDFCRDGYFAVITEYNNGYSTGTSDNTTLKDLSTKGYFIPRKTDGSNKDFVGTASGDVNCMSPVSLGLVRFDGTGTQPYALIRGLIYKFNTEKNNHRGGFDAANTTGGDSMFNSRTIIRQPIVGNFDGNMQGREQAFFAISSKIDSIYRVEIGGWYYKKGTGDNASVMNGDGLRSSRWQARAANISEVVLTAPDADTNDGYIAKFKDKEYTCVDPEVMAILEAAPYFEDLKDEYRETLGGTTFGKGKGSGSGGNVQGSTSAGAYVSYEQDISIFGIKIGSWEASSEFKLEWSWEKSTEKTWTYEMEFDGGRDSNQVVLICTPVTVYHYEVYDVADGKWKPMDVTIADKPVYTMLSVEEYNAVAELRGDPTIGSDIVSAVPGQPDTYRTSASGLKNVYVPDQLMEVGHGSSTITQSITSEQTDTFSDNLVHSIDVSAGLGAGGFKVGVTGGFSIGGGWSETDTSSLTRSGTVGQVPDGYEDYSFNWKFITWDATFGEGNQKYTVPVLGYIVTDVKQPPSMPQNVEADPGTDSVTLTWEPGFNSAAYYEVYRYVPNDPTGKYYYNRGTVNGSEAVDGKYTFTDTELQPGTQYQYTLRAVGVEITGGLLYSNYIEPMAVVTASTAGTPKIVSQTKGEVSILPNTSTAFEVIATPAISSNNLSFQWQSRAAGENAWKNLANKEDYKLTVTGTAALDGTDYRCMVAELTSGSLPVFIYSEPVTLKVGKADSTAALTASATSGNADHSETKTEYTDQEVVSRYKINVGGDDTPIVYEAYAAGTDTIYRNVANGKYYQLNGLTGLQGPDATGVYTGTAESATALTDLAGYLANGSTNGSTVITNINDLHGTVQETATFDASGKKVSADAAGAVEYNVFTATGVAVQGADPDLQQSTLTLYQKADGSDTNYYVAFYEDQSGTQVLKLDSTALQAVTGNTTSTNFTYLSGTLRKSWTTEKKSITIGTESKECEVYTDSTDVKVYKYTEYETIPVLDDNGNPIGNETVTVVKSETYYYGTTTGEGEAATTTYTALTGFDQGQQGIVDNDAKTVSGIVTPGAVKMTTVSVPTTGITTVNGDPVTLRAVISANSTTPSGNVNFQITNTTTGLTTTQTAAVSGGTASVTWTPSTEGVYTIRAVYGGSSTAEAAASNTVTYYATAGTDTLYDIRLPAAPQYGDTISPSLYKGTTADNMQTVTGAVFTYHKYLGTDASGTDNRGYETTGTPIPTGGISDLLPGAYLIKASVTEGSESEVVASKIISVSKRAITVTLPNFTVSTEEARSIDWAERLKTIQVTNSDDSTCTLDAAYGTAENGYSNLFALSGNSLPASTGNYDLSLGYASTDLQSDFLSKYMPTINRCVATVTTGSYTVAYTAGVNGALTANNISAGSQGFATGASIKKGSKLLFKAEPDEGFQVSKWTVKKTDGTELTTGFTTGANTLTLNALDCDLVVTVEFSNETHEVTFGPDAAGNGTVTATQLGTTLVSGNPVVGGSSVTFTAAPADGYVVKQWSVAKNDGTADVQLNPDGVTAYTGTTLTLDNIDADTAVTVTFEPAGDPLQVTFGAVKKESGSLVAADDVVNFTADGLLDGKAAKGSTVVLTATVTPGTAIQEWQVSTDNGTTWTTVAGSVKEYTIYSLQADTRIRVLVTTSAASYPVTFSMVDGTGAAVSGAGTLTATYNGGAIESGTSCMAYTTVVFTYTESENYELVNWEVTGTTGTAASSGKVHTYTIDSLDATTEVKAKVQKKPQIAFTQPANGTITVTGTIEGVEKAIESGKWVDCGKAITVTVTPEDNYVVTEIKAVKTGDSSAVVKTITNDSKTSGAQTMSFIPEENVTISATLVEKPQVTIGSVSNGTVTATGTKNGSPVTITSTDKHVDFGSTVTVTATPNSGYVAEKINGTEVNTGKANGSKTKDITVNSDTTLTAAFLAKPVVTIDNSSANGSVSYKATKDGSEQTLSANSYVDFGANLTVTLKPGTGYEVGSVTGQSPVYTDEAHSDEMAYTIANVQADQTIAPVWAAIPQHAVTYSVVDTNGMEPGGTNGTLTASVNRKGLEVYKVDPFTGGDVYRDSNATFTAAPASGYRVKEWTINGEAYKPNGTTYVGRTLTLDNIDAAKTVTVQFMEVGSKVTIAAGSNGSIASAMVGGVEQVDNIASGFTLSEGAAVAITAKPDTGYEVACWSVNGEAQSDSSQNTFTYTAQTEGVGAAITVTFRQVEYPVSWGGANGTVTAGGYEGASANIRGGTSVTFTAAPSNGYVITGWTVNGETQTGQTGNTFIWTVPNGKAETPAVDSYEVKAVFGRGKYAVTVTQPANGTITADAADLAAVTGDTAVTFTAEPNEGYILIGWTVDGVTTDTRSLTHTVTVTAPTTVAAVLVPSHYTVSCVADGETMGSTVTVSGSEKTSASVAYGKSVSFTAAPAPYYHVSGWKVDGVLQSDTANRNTFTLTNVTGPHTVTAVFEGAIRYEVRYKANTNGTLSATNNGAALTLTPDQTANVWGGAKLVFTAAPAAGATNYMVAKWTVNGTAVTRDNMTELGVTMDHYLSNTLTVESLSKAMDIQVSFEAYTGFTIPTDDTGYTVTAGTRNPDDTTPITQIRKNGDVTFTVAPTGDYTNISTLVINGYDCIAGKLIEGKTAPDNCLSVAAVSNADGSYTVTITGVTAAIDTDIEAHKVVVDDLVVPDALAGMPELDTKEEIQNKLETKLTGSSANREFYDIALKYHDGTGWQAVAEGNFPANGVDVVLDYPTGTDSKDSFTIVHMLTTAAHAGELEMISPEKKADGLHFHVTSLSPFGISWTKYVAPSGGGGGGGGAAAPAETVIVKDSANGKVTADNTCAAKGDTVTLTVTPDKGYTLETLIVTDKNGGELKLTEKNGKYTFTMPASNVTVKATFMEDNAMLNFFVDVPADAYYYDAVLWAAKEGITGGTDAVHFSPNAACTRAQAVTFLWRAAGSPAPKADANPFTDVKAGAYYDDAVLWAVENGVTAGTTATTFSPDATCTRAQIVTFLWRSQKAPASDSVNPFTDVAADTYYANAVMWAAENGVTGGTTATTFSPNNDCTRAQIVTFLYRCMK